MKYLELLAPAKNLEIGTAAIDCGADAIYIAGPSFGAREKASNSVKDIAQLCNYAHKWGCKIFLTLNTILKDYELKEAEHLIWEAYRAGCNAVIIQDLAILKMNLPPIELHASTQCDIRTPEKAKLLESLGFSRLILARELSINQIKKIKEATTISLECFIHGALCVSYSGQCYMSEYLTGRSANRGSCVQACRNNYTLIDSNNNILLKDFPILSLKDLNLTNHLKELIEAGVTSFKIEGRLKNESYVKNIVSHYNKELNNICKENRNYKRTSLGESLPQFNSSPIRTFNRGFTNYFITGKREKLNSSIAKYIGEQIGEVVDSKSKNGIVEFKYTGEKINNGDGLTFVHQNGKIEGNRANNCIGDKVILSSHSDIRPLPKGVKIYRNYNISFEKDLAKKVHREIPVKLEIECFKERISIDCKGYKKFEFDIIGEEAKNLDLAKNTLANQLSKKGEIFSFSVHNIKNCKYLYKVSILNQIRREIAQNLLKEISLQTDKESCKQECKTKLHFITQRIDKRIIDKALSFYTKSPNHLSYLANSSNKMSGEVYKSLGYSTDLYLPAKQFGTTLMRTKYCIRKERGICLKENTQHTNELFLLNNKNKFKLVFDCSNCEMVIIGEDKF